MEQQKDIIQKDAEIKGQNGINIHSNYSQNMAEDNIKKTTEDKFDLTLAKAEKLATATYMVTDFIPAIDPIRTKIKECSLDFLSDIYATNGASYSERIALYRKVISTVEKICGLLGVASSVGFVSGMNYSILRTEYSSFSGLIGSLDEIRSSVEGAYTFKEEFFAVDKMIPAPLKRDYLKRSDTQDYKGQSIIKDMIDNHLSLTPKSKSEAVKINRPAQKDVRSSSESKGDRRENILRVLRKKGNITIKDLSQAVSGCSEKTIQRELLSMVAVGVLKKEGEKRWSRYSLAQ